MLLKNLQKGRRRNMQEKHVRWREFMPLIIILFIAAVAMILCDRPLARGDGLAYFIWLDSIAGDGDMDLSNQAQIFAHLNNGQVQWNEKTGKWISLYPYGSALLLAPAYWLGSLMDRIGWFSVNPEYFINHQGRPLPYSLFPMFAINIYALGAIVLAYLCARMYVPALPAAVSAFFLFLGTPMLYYSSIEPFFSHVPATFLVSLTIYLILKWEEKPRSLLAIVAGIAGGMATLTRWQMALTILPFAFLFLRRRAWLDLVLFAIGFCMIAWHPFYTWKWMFGRSLVEIHTENRFVGFPKYVIQVLFSGGRGLFIWSPLTVLALIGLILLRRYNWTVAVILLTSFSLQVLINSAVVADWWAGWSFGMRRMTELYPVFVIGLAALLAYNRSVWLRNGIWTISIVGLFYSLLLFVSHLNFINTALPQGDAAWVEIAHQLFRSSFRITVQVFREHYGPWAWSRPGP
jgi:hypothetical protein